MKLGNWGSGGEVTGVSNWAAGRWGALLCLAWLAGPTVAGISEDRVLILVNGASADSQYAASFYRQCHPGIPLENVVLLTGLGDMTSSADEIISRDDFETHIAEPVRQHLLDHGLVDHIWVIVTTAGMPYRIADSTYPDVVQPHGGSCQTVMDHAHAIDAASVESELAVLWQIDPSLDPNHRAPLAARLVNPYHGYVSPMASFCSDRDILGRRETFKFAAPLFDNTRVYEGQEFSFYRATGGRQFCVKDMYLVARLDGPRGESLTPLYFIVRMLEMAARVSNPSHPDFHGYDPACSVVVIDDKTSGTVSDNNSWYNVGTAVQPSTYPYAYPTSATYPTPPNVGSTSLYRDDFRYAFRSLTGNADLPDPNLGEAVQAMGPGMIGGPVLYEPSDALVHWGVDPNFGVGGLCSFGIHQHGVSSEYLLTGGPGGTELVHPVYGAIFNSTESFNAVTFFVDAPIPTSAKQGLIWQWFYIQGSGALGHVFEPMASSVADNDLLFYNYFRDADFDGIGDMTFVEAAYTAIPYLSWAPLVVGDPLMRIHQVYGSGPGWWEGSICGTGAGEAMVGTVFLLSFLGLVRWRTPWRGRSVGWWFRDRARD